MVAVSGCHAVIIGLIAQLYSVLGGNEESHYLNEFVVEVRGGETRAAQVAQELGFTYVMPVISPYNHLTTILYYCCYTHTWLVLITNLLNSVCTRMFVLHARVCVWGRISETV